MLHHVRATREALRYRRERPWWWHQQQQLEGDEEGAVLDGGAAEALATTTTTSPASLPRKKPRGTSTSTTGTAGVDSVLCLPVLGGADGQAVVGVVAAVNRQGQGPHTDRFGTEDARALAGLCAQASEALANLTRRPEERVSLGENLGMLARHAALPLHEYRPSLKALLAAERAAEAAEGEAATTEIRVPIAAAAVGPVSARAPAAPAVGGEGAAR